MQLDNLSKEELLDLLEDLNPEVDHNMKNIIIDCPACGQRECSVSIEKKGHLWGCFRLKKCGESGNIWKLLKLIGKLNFAFNRIATDIDFIDIEKILGNDLDEESNLNLEELPTITLPLGWTRVYEDEYLKSRNFIITEKCEVGRTNMHPVLKKNYVIFLVRENKKIKAWVARHVWDKSRIEQYNQNAKITNKPEIKRYRNTPGVDFSQLLYGYDEIDEKNILPVCLVEGIFDKHAIDTKLMLHENRFLYCCATFKAAVSDSQIVKLKLKGVEDIVLFYDPDVINQIKKNVQKLSNFFKVRVIISSNNKDPDEMLRDELIETMTNNVFTPGQIVDNFIQLPNWNSKSSFF